MFVHLGVYSANAKFLLVLQLIRAFVHDYACCGKGLVVRRYGKETFDRLGRFGTHALSVSGRHAVL